MLRSALVIAVSSLALSGCGAVIFKKYEIEDTNKPLVMTIDAKQRFAFVMPRDGNNQKSSDRVIRTNRIVCVEPSPDTMVGVSASLGLDLPLQTGSAGVAASMAQAVAQIGTRTQTIALLRDGLYRACEAYINGLMNEEDYELMLRHYDMTMVMLVAIDGLTHTCAPQAGISGSSQSSREVKPAAASEAPADGAGAGTTPDPAPADAPKDDTKKKAAKAGDTTTDPAKDKAKPAAPSGTLSTSAQSTTTQTSATGCASPDKVAAEVREMVVQFFNYKKPLHRQACIVGVVRKLTTDNAPVPYQAALALARDVCAVDDK